ncbi:fibroblast growth factor receptor substrate 2 [Amyelois transitella]|uniref:fibroblast growth factor receptor substrate 2 n=1 Tax=Amyelois transitella TaxID=680683 RepID=UPI00067C2D90|nr:fibroblast growth factor receptor substrate 2 [Amyelois transitella]
MGCFQSKKDSSDIHPNVFRVVNIDTNGVELCRGQLEISESDVILYRKGRDSTVWPLHSVRRYGFREDLFSFESGRRCETGAGIFGFRCRRASVIFNTLQQQIELRSAIQDTLPFPVSQISPAPQAGQTLQVSIIHCTSVDNSQPELVLGQLLNNNFTNNIPNSAVRSTQSPRSPSSVDILEVMPLYPRSQTNTNHVTNVYQMRELKREHNNNTQAEKSNPQHLYSNDLNRDLAILRNNLRQEAALNTMRDIEDETIFLENRYINENLAKKLAKNLMSPTLSNSSEHYAELNIEQQENKLPEAARLYMNILCDEANLSDDSDDSSHSSSTPTTLKPLQYCNLSVGKKVETNTYANLSLGDKGDSIKVKQSSVSQHSDHNQKISESDTLTSTSPDEELEVNYAVLDIDANKEQVKASKESDFSETQLSSSRNESAPSCSSQPRSRLISQGSMEKSTGTITSPSATIGYTTIDFDKTVALTSVAAGAEMDADGQRKTRHDSCNVFCGSPTSVDKCKGSNN